MKVSERFEDLFTKINAETELLIFDFIEPSTLDKIYNFKYGNRELTSKTIATDDETIVIVIDGLFSKKWNDYFLTVTSALEEMKNYTETIKETITDSGSLDFNRNSINKVSAYNVDDFVDNSSDDNLETSLSENEKIREYEINKLKDVGHYEKVISYLNKNNMYDIIMEDINSILTKIIF